MNAGPGSTWIILGASSAMARAFARETAMRGQGVILAGREEEDLTLTATDCRLRGAPLAEIALIDLREPAGFAPLVARAAALEGTLNVAVFAGSMPPQEAVDADPAMTAGVVADSYLGPMHLLHLLAPLIEARGGGTVVGVGSVAGDRGRIKNYVYGSAKAGFATYLSGLRNRLGRSGGHVLTVKPGFVDTAMSWGHPGMFLIAQPAAVAADIWRAVERRRDVIYTPFFWRWIMLIIRSVPERIFKRLSL